MCVSPIFEIFFKIIFTFLRASEFRLEFFFFSFFLHLARVSDSLCPVKLRSRVKILYSFCIPSRVSP